MFFLQQPRAGQTVCLFCIKLTHVCLDDLMLVHLRESRQRGGRLSNDSLMWHNHCLWSFVSRPRAEELMLGICYYKLQSYHDPTVLKEILSLVLHEYQLIK